METNMNSEHKFWIQKHFEKSLPQPYDLYFFDKKPSGISK